jgi:hypothetical protein
MSTPLVPMTDERKEKEENFDQYYQKVISMNDHLERIKIVSERLERKYADYRETKEFVGFLRSIEEVFAHAEKEKWSVEKTQDEMIKSEIYLLSQISGVDEAVFQSIYQEFTNASGDVARIQTIAKDLMDRYADENTAYAKECVDFIMFVRDSLLVFSHTISGDESFDEISEAKTQIIRLRMESMAADNNPPLPVLQKIYEEFMEELHIS